MRRARLARVLRTSALERTTAEAPLVNCVFALSILIGYVPLPRGPTRRSVNWLRQEIMDDAAVKAAWNAAGRPDGYRPPTEQEEKDLADSRHRGRGEKQQKKRHTSNQRELQRFLREAAMAETHRVCHPARC